MIITKNLVIRPMDLGDELVLYKWWNDGEMMAHAGFQYGVLQSKTTIRKKIEAEVNEGELFPSRKRFILCLKESMTPIGEMNYHNYDPRNGTAEFGIKICELDQQGKGYGEEALRAFIDFMFAHLNLNKIELTTMPDNERSQALYKKLGFKMIGIIRESYFDSRANKYSDIIYMDLLKREWMADK